MKTLLYLGVCMSVILLASCSSSKKNDGKDITMAAHDSISADSVQRMQVSESKVAISYKGKQYSSSVVRKPDSSLPVVQNDQGDRFSDNRITLQLTCGGSSIVNKTFTKDSFSSLVDANFLKHAILEGLVYDKVTPQGIRYVASICYPQTDLYIPLSLTISADGRIAMAKEEMLEDLYDTDSIQ